MTKRTRAKPGEARAFILKAFASDTDNCIIWPFALSPDGYAYAGKLDGSGSGLVSREVCKECHGPGFANAEAAHLCRTPACINPKHLCWKTAKENTADRKVHGTENTGTQNGHSKLTWDQVSQIRLAKGLKTQKQLGLEFGVSASVICQILNGKIWKIEVDITADPL